MKKINYALARININFLIGLRTSVLWQETKGGKAHIKVK